MSKILLREQALKLRSQGNTYSQIKKILGVEKSTLSGWLTNYSLTQEQTELLIQNRLKSRDLAVEKFRTTMHNKRLKRLKSVLDEQEKNLLPLTERELFLAGLFLYWGEGSKLHGQVTISNTDPKIIKFAYYWMINILKAPKEKIKIGLHLYKDMDVEESIKYWSELLDIPKSQFHKPYIKKTNRADLTYKSYGHGTCNLVYSSVEWSEKIAMSIKAISSKYGLKSDLFWYN